MEYNSWCKFGDSDTWGIKLKTKPSKRPDPENHHKNNCVLYCYIYTDDKLVEFVLYHNTHSSDAKYEMRCRYARTHV